MADQSLEPGAAAPLPPGLDRAGFAAARSELRAALGVAKVLETELDREAYLDPYALGPATSRAALDHASSMALVPESVEEVQAIVRTANRHHLPLWPVARGRNLGYGGAAPVLAGTAVVDCTRMNKILDVDAEFAHATIEPGVGFYQMHEHLTANNIPLWMSVPGNGWGSILGNALERGIGYTPYGDNTGKLCGLEVVLPSGEIVRTGMGAMEGNKAWASYQHGFGPGWDQMFVQSSLGIVTKANLWLMPEPELSFHASVNLPRMEDIEWAIDVLAKLRLTGVVDHNVVFGNYLHDAGAMTTRADWYDKPGPLPADLAERIQQKFGVGWWTFHISVYGEEPVALAKKALIDAAFKGRLKEPIPWKPLRAGEPRDAFNLSAGVPFALPLAVANWFGGRGGHIGFSPIMPASGKLAYAAFLKRKQRFEEAGLDYYSSFTMGHRHIANVNMILYDRDNDTMTAAARHLFHAMIADAHAEGYGEYRTHIDFMDEVARSFDFNDHALLRLNQAVKDTLDPNGVLAPGKNGIWPRRLRTPGRGA